MKKSFLRKISFMISQSFMLTFLEKLVNVSAITNNDDVGNLNKMPLTAAINNSAENLSIATSQIINSDATISDITSNKEVVINKVSLLSNLIYTCTMQDDMISTWSSKYGIFDYNVNEMVKLSAMVK